MQGSSESPVESVVTRRRHKKSRTGCRTCRKRHVRCDEQIPICRNCERGGRLCDYRTQKEEMEEALARTSPDSLYLYPGAEASILSTRDLVLLRNFLSFGAELQFNSTSKYSLWMRRLPFMISEHRFLLDSLLGVSASIEYSARMTPEAEALALRYRGDGLKGLQSAIEGFSEQNADAILAASLVLSWYGCDWSQWSTLMRGTRVIAASMQSQKGQSCFFDLIEEELILPEYLQPSLPQCQENPPPTAEEIADLDQLLAELQMVKHYVKGQQEESTFMDQVLDFMVSLRMKIPIKTPYEQFEVCQTVRYAAIWVPRTLHRKVRREPAAMIAAAYFHAAIIVIHSCFPAMGAMFFGRMGIGPITEISTYLDEQRHNPMTALAYDWDEAAGMMLYPIETVRRFREKLGWVPLSSNLMMPSSTIGLSFDASTSPDSSPEL